MESENIYQHHQLQQQQQQQQQQLVYSPLPSSSSSSSPIVSTAQEWNPSSIVLVGDEFNRYMNEILPSSREYFWPKNIDLVPSVKRSIFEVDHYTKPCEFRSYVHPLPEKLLQFDDNTPKGSLSDGFLKSCDTNVSILNNSCVKNGQEQDVIDLNQNLWISSFSDIGPMKQKLPQTEVFPGLATCPPTYMSNCSSGSTTDHHYSNLFASTSVLPTSVTLPLPTHNLKHTNYDDEGRTDQPFAERMSSGYSKVQQSSESLSNSSNKTAIFRKDVWRKNKHLKPTHAACDDEVAKKPRVVPHASSPTLKIRKEKLGDRIAGLHRMVSPFGKTDTASVLTEAFGYIQFLQDQIQTLSISYFKSSHGRLCPTTRGGQPSMKEWKDEEEQKTQDLRSRGLCLVPLAFTSYVCSYNGSIW